MKKITSYTPPSTNSLTSFKRELDMTGNQMADLAGLADGRQWRKYTGGATPRELSAQMLFMLAARLTLSDAELEAVYAKMREIGAEIELGD
ncbi:XRE family transcriptional regulator [Pseudomonas typographi]|uniref:XRE family transcriptional regulator n=1 Tax=Pseudomonas typographi TaxID=2715964 RepID=UPI0016824A22|nr:XRE family transcriptional regulator [Pseudomonas typographi]MBD1589767.1 XRE family transcriptional regulator [Pseudomonas typographi]